MWQPTTVRLGTLSVLHLTPDGIGLQQLPLEFLILRYLYLNSSNLFPESQSQLLNKKAGKFGHKLSSVTLITDRNSKWSLCSQDFLLCALQKAHNVRKLSLAFVKTMEGHQMISLRPDQTSPEPVLRCTKLLYTWQPGCCATTLWRSLGSNTWTKNEGPLDSTSFLHKPRCW